VEADVAAGPSDVAAAGELTAVVADAAVTSSVAPVIVAV